MNVGYSQWGLAASRKDNSLVQEPVYGKSQSVTGPVTTAKKHYFGEFLGMEGVNFFTKLYRDHIDLFLSELGYTELVQR